MDKVRAVIKAFVHPLKGLDALIEWMARDASLPPVTRDSLNDL
jgi:hypothetical protein